MYPVRPVLFILVQLMTATFALRSILRQARRAGAQRAQLGTRAARLGMKGARRRIGFREIPRRLTKIRKRSSKAGRQAVKRAKGVAVKTASYLARRPPVAR